MTLYHYTSIESLYAIIKNINAEEADRILFTLRATHACFLNDLTEGQLLGKALRKLGVSEGLLSILNSIQDHPFVVSLSELEDDLNMWRCYSNQGKGVAIGLDKEMIDDAIKHNVLNNVADFKQCKYITEDELVEDLKSQHVETMIQDSNILPLQRLLLDALVYKNKSFEAEKEWRIYAYWFESDFRVFEGSLIPFYDIQLPIEAIVSITFGPKCDYEKNSFSAYRMIKATIGEKWAEKIVLKKSTVPLS